MSRSSVASGTLLQIGDLANLTGASHRSLRYYEQQGLLTAHRRANGYRLYTTAAVDRVHRIKVLLQLGLSIKVIGPLLPCFVGSGPDVRPSTCPELRATLRSELKRLDGLAAELERTRGSIVQVLETAEAAEDDRRTLLATYDNFTLY